MADDGTRTRFLPLRKGESAAYRLSDLGMELTVPDNSLYSDVFIHMSAWDGDASAATETGGLVTVAKPIRFGPASLALRKPIRIRYGMAGASDERAAFYKLDEKKAEWQFAGFETTNDTLSASVKVPGVYGVLVDSEPPKVSAAEVRSRQSYATGATIRELVVPIEDMGSGVDDERCILEIDGRKRIARWDGYLGKMFVVLAEETGAIDVHIVAVDRVGNEVHQSSRVDTDAGKEKD